MLLIHIFGEISCCKCTYWVGFYVVSTYIGCDFMLCMHVGLDFMLLIHIFGGFLCCKYAYWVGFCVVYIYIYIYIGWDFML